MLQLRSNDCSSEEYDFLKLQTRWYRFVLPERYTNLGCCPTKILALARGYLARLTSLNDVINASLACTSVPPVSASAVARNITAYLITTSSPSQLQDGTANFPDFANARKRDRRA